MKKVLAQVQRYLGWSAPAKFQKRYLKRCSTLIKSISVLAFLLPAGVSAQVVISEIMYNPFGRDAGREWVELYNAGSASVSIVGGTIKGSWRISDGSSHTFTDPSGGLGRGTLTVSSHGYMVISKDPPTFLGDFPSGSFSVIKSSISLNNTAGSISISDGDGVVLDHVSYNKSQGGVQDGTSLQKTSSGEWVSAPPTPGADNATTRYASTTNPDSMSVAPPLPSSGSPIPTVKPVTVVAAPVPPLKNTSKNTSHTSHENSSASQHVVADPVETATDSPQVAAVAASSSPWWIVSVVVLIVFGVGALFMAKRKTPVVEEKLESDASLASDASEWNIIDESEE